MTFSPYPISGIPENQPAGGGGVSVFDSPDALAINAARMAHLGSLDLPLSGRSVLDAGCGVGHLARFFVERGCRVTCVDARAENIEVLRQRLPGIEAHVADVETDSLAKFGRFDVVFSYGLLYHLESPIAGLRNLASASADLLLLETVVTDHRLPLVRFTGEPVLTVNQALGGFGCRPSPAFVAMALSGAGFGFIYAPVSPPDHPDFQFQWTGDLEWQRDDHLLRCIFIASRKPLDNPKLALLHSSPVSRPPAAGSSSIAAPASGASKSRIWLDVGAHLGEKTFAAAQNDPNLRVYAFEPNLRIAAQRMGQAPNYIVLPMAVAERDGSAEFYLNGFTPASSLLPFAEGLGNWLGKESLQSGETITVPTIRLDTFLNQAGIPGVEYLKIDARGADLAVIRSAGDRLADIERIALEVQTTSLALYRGASTKEEVVQYLEDAGFELESAETRSQGQEENLTFVRSLYRDAAEALMEARSLAFTRPLEPYPGWTFGSDWDNPLPDFQARRRIWTYFNRRRLDTPMEFDWCDGIRLALRLGNDMSRQLFIAGCVEPNEMAFLDRYLAPGMVVVDAGANEGLHTLLASRRVREAGSVLAFEPSSRELERLKANLEGNGVGNVMPFGLALTDYDGEALLAIAGFEHEGQNTLGEFVHSGVSLLRTERVAARTLDGILAELRIPRVDLIKIDVEGGEAQVIKGASKALREARPALLFEALDTALRKQGSSRDELLQLIRSLGYVLYAFDLLTGLPVRTTEGEGSENLIAVPQERPLPEDWCAPAAPPPSKAGVAEECASTPLIPVSGADAPFDLADHRLSGASQATGNPSPVSGGGLTVVTPPEQWAYALLFPVQEEARRALAPASRVVIRLNATVEEGRIGAGIIAGDGQTYLTPERELAAGDGDAFFALEMRSLPEHCALVVRNTARGGTASKICIRSIESSLWTPPATEPAREDGRPSPEASHEKADGAPLSADPTYRIAEVHMFDTCTHRCGYCWFAESGQVLDFKQLEPFRSKEWIARVASFFNSRTSGEHKWILQFTGGEPLIAPNLDLLCHSLFGAGNRAAFYTALLIGRDHPGFRFLCATSPPEVDYVMASFHPEAELDEGRYFEKIEALKDAGHNVILRYVGHPARLHRLAELSEKCSKLGICFYPMTLLSSNYPGRYRPEERDLLASYFSSLSQHVMLEGGVATDNTRCFGGSRIIAANLQTGDITPCITVHGPVLGNIFRDTLVLYAGPISCTQAGVNCICDVHFQQNIVIGCGDSASFDKQKRGFVAPRSFSRQLDHMRQNGFRFCEKATTGIGEVVDESRLFYSIDEVRSNYRRTHGEPPPSPAESAR